MGLYERTLRHMGMPLLNKIYHLPLWTWSDLLLLAKQDFQQMSRHLKSHITTISCFCDSFMVYIRLGSVSCHLLTQQYQLLFSFLLSSPEHSLLWSTLWSMHSHSVVHLIGIQDTPPPSVLCIFIKKIISIIQSFKSFHDIY